MRSKTFLMTVAATALILTGAASAASAAILVYGVNLNFDPSAQDGGPGVGTITGTFSINSNNLDLTNIDLTEKTNTSATFGGAFGTQTFTSLIFDNSSLSSAQIGQASYKFGGDPYLAVFVQSNCCVIDGVNVSPSFQFDFAYPQGGAVQPGNFDSITSGTNYLYGDVMPAAVPEPATWAMMLLGLGMIAGGLWMARRKNAVALAAAYLVERL